MKNELFTLFVRRDYEVLAAFKLVVVNEEQLLSRVVLQFERE